MTDARIKRCYFDNCALCAAHQGAPVECAGHDEADSLGMLPLQRILLHNAEAAAMYARLRQAMAASTDTENSNP